MTLADPRTHDDAIVDLLEDAGIVVGDGTYPEDDYGWQGVPGQSNFVPYAIVYPLRQTFDGSLGCPDTDSELRWQITCVGRTREQCDWVLHRVDETLIGRSLTVSGRSIPRIRADGGAGVRRDDTVQPPVFIATPQYAAWSF